MKVNNELWLVVVPQKKLWLVVGSRLEVIILGSIG